MPRQQRINPQTNVDTQTEDRIFNEWRGKPLGEINADYDRVSNQLEKAWEQAGETFDVSKIECINGSVPEKCEALVQLNSELSGLNKAANEKGGLEEGIRQMRSRNRGGGQEPEGNDDNPWNSDPTIRGFINSPPASAQFLNVSREQGYDSLRVLHNTPAVEFNCPDIFNTLFETSTGWDPEDRRRPGYVPIITRPIQVLDILSPPIPSTQPSVQYMEHTTFTNAAAEVGEGDAAPEAALEFTEVTHPMIVLGVRIPVTEVQLEDVPQVRNIIDQQLIFMLRQRLDGRVLLGTGSSGQLAGITTRTGIQDQDWTYASNAYTNPIKDIRRAQTKCRVVGRAGNASHVILNDYLWDEIVLSETTSAGFYLGSPAGEFVQRIWGLPVVTTDHLSNGTTTGDIGGLVGNFRVFSELHMRRDFNVQVGMQADDFNKFRLMVRASVRVCMVTTRPKAFVTITHP